MTIAWYCFPVLYDVTTVVGDKVIKSKRGFYNYDKDIFVLPKRVFQKIKENHPLDFEVVSMVGYEVVP